ncbi:CheR family methyltransferase [Helicobacter cappadocius]|uniref:Protein-glutamate O-methyltransferase CheR n=1 Tax=Helicobacter cappadocius TaxID=3063998 RepID=A0AA90Q1B4_9HELI|nr:MULTISPECIES: protein-glutamate O-methyltransferase CheR [unclassified Helicobacter]MDO7252466.1 protein-glutamate O-methyltransferase CheR [Helicobacter sp. faydin-H75]MDP2538333.1 protein-glutamate O-methyltransferase CheR [Helicobacter sp. faydin-H76]
MFFRKKEKEPIVEEKPKLVPLPSDDDGLVEFIQTIKKISGVDLTPKQDVIKHRLSYFAQAHSIATFRDLSNKILGDSLFRQEALNLVTVNETYFYRELLQLEIAVDFAKSLQGNIRILSAPCSSGDEVYSIGMLISQAGINIDRVSICGIDINSDAIKQGEEGIYSARSLHRLSNELRNSFFDPLGKDFKIKKRLLPKCEYKLVNIFDEDFLNLGEFDIIFSRNMMIYFDEAYRLKTIERFYKVLKDNGRMYVGHADLIPNSVLFDKNMIGRVVYYQKAKKYLD